MGARASEGIRKAMFAAKPPFANIRRGRILRRLRAGEEPAQMYRAFFPLGVLVRRNV
jgi:hypothetical protein